MIHQAVSSPTSPIRVLVVDDQKMMRAIFTDYASSADDIVVVGTAHNGLQGVEQALTLDPDVVLMDVEMPEMDGISATRILSARNLKAKVLIVSTSYDDRYLAQALRNGASGYLLKTTAPEELVSAIRGVHEGSLQFGSGVLQRELSSLAPGGIPAEPNRKVKMPDPAEARKMLEKATPRLSEGETVSSTNHNQSFAARNTNAVSNGHGSSAETLNAVQSNRVRNLSSQASAKSGASRELATELSRIRAAYWVLNTEQKKMRRWLNFISFVGAGALAVLFLVLCLIVF